MNLPENVSVLKFTDQKFALHRVLARSGVKGIWVSKRVTWYVFWGLGYSYDYLRKIQRAECLWPSLVHNFKCTCCISSCHPINFLMKWKAREISKQVQGELKGIGEQKLSWERCQMLQKFCLQLHPRGWWWQRYWLLAASVAVLLPCSAPLLSPQTHRGLEPSCGLPPAQVNALWMAWWANLID